MRRILIVAHILGISPRMRGLAKYLPEFEWEPILLTPAATEGIKSQSRVIETPYPPVLDFWRRLFGLTSEGTIRRELKSRLGIVATKSVMDWFLTRCAEIVNYPDSERQWKTRAVSRCIDCIEVGSVDGMISSSAPVTSHLIARELKLRYQVPWVADLPDLWSQNNNYSYGRVRRMFDTKLEHKTLQMADALVTVSGPWREKLRQAYGDKPTYCVTNGFEPAQGEEGSRRQPAKFTITHTGTVYPEWQKPSLLFWAIRDLINERTINPDEVEVSFYGTEEPWFDGEIAAADLERIVHRFPRVPYEEALEKQRESHLLLVLNWEDHREKGCYPLKVFEYLGARRPILAIGGSGDDVVTDLLNETRAGRSCPDVDAIKQYLLESYREFQNGGTVRYPGNEARILKYSYREMAAQFAEILDRVTGSNTA